jgi:NitT/TauT family transport system substrate-binding protein
VSESSIFAVLASHGLKPSDVQMIAIGDFGAGLTALEHNKIDIAIIPEPIYSQKMKAGAKYKIIPWLDSKLPPYTQTVGIATNEMIAKKGAQLAAVIEGRRKGVDVLYSDPKATAAALAKAYNLPIDIATSALAGTLKQSPKWWSRGELEMKQMELTAQSLKDTGAFEGDVDWKAAIDDHFIPKDLQSKTQ